MPAQIPRCAQTGGLAGRWHGLTESATASHLGVNPPMVKSSNIRIHLLVATALAATSCSDGRSVDNASPRITDIPQQATAGGATFSLDLSAYVSDRESTTLSYSVVTGGGSFTDSTRLLDEECIW